MKRSTLALALGTAALLVGCGGGGGSASPGGTGGGSSSSTGGSSSSTGGSSSSTAGGNGSPAASLTLNSVDDVKGYTLKTNDFKSTLGGTTYELTISISVGCDGSWTYTDDGTASKHVANGQSISLNNYNGTYTLSWSGGSWTEGGLDANVNDPNGAMLLGMSNTIIAGSSCWFNVGDGSSGANCPSGLFIETITKDKVCQ